MKPRCQRIKGKKKYDLTQRGAKCVGWVMREGKRGIALSFGRARKEVDE